MIFELGDEVICKSTGVIGNVISFYKPTACKEQTMVFTKNGNKYHAPTDDWTKLDGNCANIRYFNDCCPNKFAIQIDPIISGIAESISNDVVIDILMNIAREIENQKVQKLTPR